MCKHKNDARVIGAVLKGCASCNAFYRNGCLMEQILKAKSVSVCAAKRVGNKPINENTVCITAFSNTNKITLHPLCHWFRTLLLDILGLSLL